MSKRKSKSPKKCTIGLADIAKSVKAFARLPTVKQLAALRQRRRNLLRRNSMMDADWATVRAIDSIPPDPGPGHPCRALWLATIQKVYEADLYLSALSACLLLYPPPPPPPIVT